MTDPQLKARILQAADEKWRSPAPWQESCLAAAREALRAIRDDFYARAGADGSAPNLNAIVAEALAHLEQEQTGSGNLPAQEHAATTGRSAAPSGSPEIARQVEQAFKAGWEANNQCDVWATSEDKECDAAFAAYLKEQPAAGQPSVSGALDGSGDNRK